MQLLFSQTLCATSSSVITTHSFSPTFDLMCVRHELSHTIRDQTPKAIRTQFSQRTLRVATFRGGSATVKGTFVGTPMPVQTLRLFAARNRCNAHVLLCFAQISCDDCAKALTLVGGEAAPRIFERNAKNSKCAHYCRSSVSRPCTSCQVGGERSCSICAQVRQKYYNVNHTLLCRCACLLPLEHSPFSCKP